MRLYKNRPKLSAPLRYADTIMYFCYQNKAALRTK